MSVSASSTINNTIDSNYNEDDYQYTSAHDNYNPPVALIIAVALAATWFCRLDRMLRRGRFSW